MAVRLVLLVTLLTVVTLARSNKDHLSLEDEQSTLLRITGSIVDKLGTLGEEFSLENCTDLNTLRRMGSVNRDIWNFNDKVTGYPHARKYSLLQLTSNVEGKIEFLKHDEELKTLSRSNEILNGVQADISTLREILETQELLGITRGILNKLGILVEYFGEDKYGDLKSRIESPNNDLWKFNDKVKGYAYAKNFSLLQLTAKVEQKITGLMRDEELKTFGIADEILKGALADISDLRNILESMDSNQ